MKIVRKFSVYFKKMSNYNSGIKNRIFSLSPKLEIILRRIYYKNKFILEGLAKNAQKSKKSSSKKIDFLEFIDFLKSKGVKNGSNIILHSSYAPFSNSNLSPQEIINSFLELIGKEGTLVMPAIPFFPNKNQVLTTKNIQDKNIYEYDVQNSKITTGVLPKMLFEREDSARSRHPINTIVAVGRLKDELLKDNLVGSNSMPCGKESGWYKSIKHDFFIVGLGTDLMHSMTSIHINEDISENEWLIKNWYEEKIFLIKDKDFTKTVSLKKRKDIWGALYWPERTQCEDLYKEGRMSGEIIQGINIEVVKSREVFQSIKEKGFPYPYIWLPLNEKNL